MNKKFLFTIITVSLLITGCGKIDSTNRLQQNEKPSSAASAMNSETTKSSENSTSSTTTTGNAIDYKQYLKKNWIRDTDTNFPDDGGLSILISRIEDGKIQGNIVAVGNGPAYNMDSAEFEGTVNDDTAQCRLVNDSRGNEGTVKFLFKPDSALEATIIITEKSEDRVMSLPEGTFEFTPYNLKDIKGFALIEDQTFMVDLNSWGNVKFVSGKLTAGSHVPVVFYLTNEEGDILYNFNATLPYSVDIKAVSFKDVNKDGLKDIIMIAADNYDGSSGESIAAVYLQETDGSFTNDYKLDQEINDSGNNKDINTVMSYLSSRF
ncbi:hypothetical protein [Clostridium sp. Marseille-P2415]|uniref:hypothetical protein n=1 Tax=Clostridium sp. Marseille-P2415 TaxID=1805471 RepID=UPI0009886D36|nr:hypothetical protein [Clostridium sp. Marseille-P2415]